MDAIIHSLAGGDPKDDSYLNDLTMGGAGEGPLQAMITPRDGRDARRAERENGPAAPSRGSDRDKEKQDENL